MIEDKQNQLIIYTFGCRMNEFESQCIYKIMKEIGMQKVVFVNTCAVTSESERQVRQEIRKLHRDHQDYSIIVAGCASQLHSSVFQNIQGVEFIISNELKLQKWCYLEINDWLNDERNENDKLQIQQQLLIQTKNNITENKLQSNALDWEYLQDFEDRSRAFVPIQTGCDHFCSFCIVPFTRGKFHSYNPLHIIEQVKIFVKNGYSEVVLTGIDITDYGKDVRGQQEIDTLGKLCKVILAETNLPRLRLSSVDVAEIDKDIMDLIANEPRFMPYFHISLQSGSDTVLKRMRRRHTRQDVIDFCKNVLKKRPESAFGADIITGFPGETDDEFLQSIKIVKNAPITYIHAFPYSKRERTLASLMDDDVPKKIKKERVKELIQLGEKNLKLLYQKMDGTIQKLLVERNGIARAENFAKVITNNKEKYEFGKIVETKVIFDGENLVVKK